MRHSFLTAVLACLAWAPGTARADPGIVPVVTPDGATLPGRVVEGVRVFHLVAEPVRQEVAPGLVIDAWGYNGRTPGPTIEALEGERVRVYVTNRLPEATSVHWHGMLLPSGMDGVAGLTQRRIEPGETFRYEFTLRQHGTLMYHPHFDEMTQVGLGMMGFFLIHPKEPPAARVDRDFAIFLHTWRIVPGTRRPDPTVMTEVNLATFNGRAYPGTAPLLVRTGERVRVRIANLSTDSHPIHLHGFQFRVTATDGGAVPESARFPETTVNVPTGTTRDFEFVADVAGDWALHCHKLHHLMNQMGHGLPPLLGVSQRGLAERIARLVPGYMAMGEHGMGEMADMDMPRPPNTLRMGGSPGPFGPIDMGGMFTVVKVRDELPSDGADPGWYPHPPGTVAEPARPEDLLRDGIEVLPAPEPAPGPPSPAPAGHGHGHGHGHGAHGGPRR